jgi:phytol kinase
MYLTILIILASYGLIIFLGEILSRYVSPFTIRKISHICCGLLTATTPFFLNYESLIITFVVLIILTIISKFLNIFKGIELSEKRNWGTVFFPIGILLNLIIFFPTNPSIFIISILILGISDALAALVGRNYGKIKINGFQKKTIEGTATFFLSTFLILFVSLVFIKNQVSILHLCFILLYSLILTTTELISPKALDNITIPNTSGILLLLII